VTAPPLVTVIVPVYNGAQYLGACLDSLLRQTYAPLEILVTDDASTDETPGIVASYGERIRCLRQPVTRGIYDNANAAIELARGELVAIYHADDVYDITIVEREVEFFRAHPEVGAVFCLDILVDAENREYARLELPSDIHGRMVLRYDEVLNGLLRHKNRFLMCPGAMVRAGVYREVGTYRQSRFRNSADLDMWLRIAQRHPLGILEAHLFRYRHFHGNSSQRYHYLRTSEENFFIIMDRYLAEGDRALADPGALRAYEAHRAEDRLRIAVSHYIKGELAAARRVLREIRSTALLRSWSIPRLRLLPVLYAFRALTRLPRVAPVADLFHDRWFVKRPPRPAA
jgi:glycosyltransferase involved in cell wall biosynthesis